MSFNAFVHHLLDWYALNKRDLPWRNTDNPYIIWLSEIILQQTRVAQGLPYFEKYLEAYPTVDALAAAPSEDIMRLWQGLGYYSRARNLHLCAQLIVSKYGGNFPDTYKELLQLKGVGSYTAAAIASFAFQEPVAVVDGNVFRVLSRYFGISTDIGSHAGKKEFESLANQIIPKEQPGEFNQAVMEFGALHCTPKNPSCGTCPLQQSCFAYNNGLVEQLPVKEKKVKVKERRFRYAHIVLGEHTLVKERGAGDIWQGLYDFPMEELDGLDFPQWETSEIFRDLKDFATTIVFDPEDIFKHILTHQRIFANFVKFVIGEEHREALMDWAGARGYQLISQEKLEALGKPRLILRYLNGEK